MKSRICEIPMVFLSLLGSCFLSGSATSPVQAEVVFGPAVNLGPTVNSPASETSAVLSPDGLELYFASLRPGGYGNYDIWVTKRAGVQDPWGPPVNLGPQINDSTTELVGSLSADGLTLYFNAGSPWDLFKAERASRDAPWKPRVNLGPIVNSAVSDSLPVIARDSLELFFATERAKPGDVDLWVSTRASNSDPWGPPTSLGPTVNSSVLDRPLWLSPDGRTLLFCSTRAGGLGGYDTWMTTRVSKGSAWSMPKNLGSFINTPSFEWLGAFAPDGRWCYVISDRPGGQGNHDVWQAPVIPIVDFNGDGRVDGKEVLTIAEYWGTSEPRCDIAPLPFGDGTVDTEDLILLAEYIGQEANDPTLAAHWKLDEASGISAADSAGTNNGTLLGNPTWQPTGGRIGGALEFDGGSRFIMAKSALHPSPGPFSVMAWVKGGAPGRVIVSQAGGADWLYVNHDGVLTTDLKSSGPDGKSLTSAAYVLDDQWHRVALVWDGSNRMLYVDDVAVAADTQANLATSTGGLYFGAGATLASGSFWSGRIDDVRIYQRAVKP
jgi:hypothetical protein